MLPIDPQKMLEMPVDQLGLLMLNDYLRTGQWSRHNYINAYRNAGASTDLLRVVAEAMGWLFSRGLMATDPEQSETSGFVTRIGRRVVEEGPDVFYATERLQRDLHPIVEAKARPQFIIGEYEQGVFAAMKAVEIRVRNLGGFGHEVIGVDLMNKAWGPGGKLTDPDAVKGEQEGVRALFAGCYAVFRNPSGHREVDYDDVVEAAEMVQTASLLMRLLDRAERRLQAT